ncbi:hypothetical protein D9756_004075 [Leucocoprinus leucothites]|uniref:DUF1740-domain-containing protein n=1 Tax=Leucocoprinus leucothites TaxID=201217 RepID=A0A8H5G062_9AGAR|nr:hypothetical protein D9756_004075 [Leucoagaricus leucothites]
MTSSFSSFPSSFSTFPDLDPGPSRQSDSEPSREKKRKHEKSSRTPDKGGERDRSRSRERDGEKRKGHDRPRDKDRKKEKERGHDGNRERHRHKDKERARDGDREHERDIERRSKRRHRGHDEKDRSKRRAKSPFLDELQRQRFDADLKKHDDSYRIFFTDTKGDPLILQYGGIYAGDVPKYRLHHGGRQILGLSSSWTVFRRAGKGIEVGLKGTYKLSGLSDSSARSLLALPPTKKILPSTSSTKYEEVDGVIRLPSRRGRRDPEDSYRAITTARDSDSDSESSVGSAAEYDSDEDSTDSLPTLTSQQIAIKKLEQELSEDPSAVDKWFSLLNHTLSTIPVTSRNATKARSDITVSILSRALAANPRNGSSRLLRLRYMKAGEEIWPEAKLKAEWEDALKVGGTEIWMEWLEWRIRSMRSIDGILDEVSRIYLALDENGGEFGELAKLRVFWRIAVLYRGAGFTERAMAMFQAQAELTFKHPSNFGGVTSKARLSELEEFWDSEMPRIGEEGAEGWAKWHASGKPEALVAPATALDKRDATQLDPYRQWSFDETQQDQSSLLPAKSFDQVAEVDPYATVLFSDIRPFLFEIRHPDTGLAFRLAWLSFLGLQVPGFATSLTSDFGPNWDDRWNTGYLTTQSHLNMIFPSLSDQKTVMTESTAGALVGREKEYMNSFRIPVKECGKAVVGCLDIIADGSKGLRSWWNQEDMEGVDMLLVRRIFAQLRMGVRDVAWDEMALGFESTLNLKNSSKLSKSLLSTAQDSLLHWSAHAQLERLRGRLDDARKVYQTVLISSKPPVTATGAPLLWYYWAELEWLAGKDEEVIDIIFHSVDMEITNSGVALLRAKRKLEDAVEASASSTSGLNKMNKMKERESWVKLRALLEILTGRDVASMLEVFDRYIHQEDQPDATKESLTVASLIMLYRYGFILKNPMPPTILRDRVSVAFEAYPSNSVILGIFLEGEKGQGVWGRVRGILGDNEADVGRVKDVARRVEEVWIAGWEKGRWSGEIERTRGGLAGAIESERTRASPVIWRIYLEFEIRAGDLKRAKKLLYRAIGECPFCKGLYLLAFGALRSVFTAQELNSLADLMAERGLRLRKGLDEMLECWDMEGVEEDGEASEGGESEIEQRAAEMRRLMPY